MYDDNHQLEEKNSRQSKEKDSELDNAALLAILQQLTERTLVLTCPASQARATEYT